MSQPYDAPDPGPHARRVAHTESADGYLGPEDRIEHHTRTLDRAIQLTFIADAKAAPVLALQATLAAITVSQLSSIVTLLQRDAHGAAAIAGAAALLAAYIVAALVGLVLASLVFLPRAARRDGITLEERSMVYFEDIRRFPAEEFRRRGKRLHESELEDDLLTQVHVVSTIAAAKFSHVQNAYIASGFGLVLWLSLMVWARS